MGRLKSTAVFWVVRRGGLVRHAITVSPCAHAPNSAVEGACGAAVTLRLPTPNDRVPKTRTVTARCAECTAAVGRLGARDVVWDS
ncbi:hypothetical protein BJ969_003503 [Saccharopolyspora gloriosae]|uniref:Uncharacterized protein n=1 Tax=Saccharopolyspora gloriosae TaxID=455344 RepID=A0A840NK55_9PSEU|nr:hypothetical protein [Saccharopolyspora gloriosae]